LYDMVSMVIPGYLFILCAEMASGIKVSNDFDTLAKAVILFASSWFVGLLLHYASKGIFDPVLRNLECDIRKSRKCAAYTIRKELPIRDYNKAYYKLLPHYSASVVPILEAHVAFLRSMLLVLSAALYAIIIKSCSNYCFDSACCWFLAYIILMVAVYTISLGISCHWDNRSLRLLMFLIFCILILTPIFFYFLKKEDIEFMKNIFPLPNRLSFSILALCYVAMFFIMRHRQKEIYRHVFEDDYYMRLLDTEK